GVLAERAGEDLHQRGLAGAVLAEQDVHLALLHFEVDAVQRHHAGELLADAGHAQGRRGGAHPCAAREARGGAVVPRTTRLGVSTARRGRVRPSSIRSISMLTAICPISSRGWCTVVSEMWRSAASEVLS